MKIKLAGTVLGLVLLSASVYLGINYSDYLLLRPSQVEEKAKGFLTAGKYNEGMLYMNEVGKQIEHKNRPMIKALYLYYLGYFEFKAITNSGQSYPPSWVMQLFRGVKAKLWEAKQTIEKESLGTKAATLMSLITASMLEINDYQDRVIGGAMVSSGDSKTQSDLGHRKLFLRNPFAPRNEKKATN